MIADDFTGALDAGVQFAKKGFSTKVMVYSKDMTVKAEDADVLVVDAETRHKQPLEAYRTILQIVKPAAESGVSYFFKKTDSALRGNIGEFCPCLSTDEQSHCQRNPFYRWSSGR